MAVSIYWHDYETFGSDPRRDRPVQFAGLRTDESLNIIDEPLVLYCRPAPDALPHPEACLITGITPQKALADGVRETEFIRRIHAELSRPGTCTAGYNSIRFDDEVTRHTLYRNFFDPYEREWKNGNSRWDIIDMLRLCHAVRPEGIEWARRDDGAATFRLQALTEANGIGHEAAHDALSDVRATIDLAALVRRSQPKLYDYVYSLRYKRRVLEQLDLETHRPVLHVSAMYPARHGCLGLVAPLMRHPVDSNGIIVCDLREDPAPWLSLSAGQIRERLFTPRDRRPEGEPDIPLKTVHINRCPVIAPTTVLEPERAGHWDIDMAQCRRHWETLMSARGLARKLGEVFDTRGDRPEPGDPDEMLYSGGFFGDADKRAMAQVRAASPEELASLSPRFEDPRLPEMLFRYRARNWSETLDEEEHRRWREFCRRRLHSDDGAGPGLETFRGELRRLRGEREDPREQEILDELENHAEQLLSA